MLVRRKIEKFLRVYRDGGLVFAVFKAIDYFLPSWFFLAYKGTIVQSELPQRSGKGQLERPIRWANDKDLPALASLDVPRSDLTRWFQLGCDIAVFEEDNKLIGFECYQAQVREHAGPMIISNVPYVLWDLSSTEIWCVGARVRCSHRGQRIISDIFRFSVDQYVRKGHTHALGAIDVGNIAATKAHARRGFHPVADILLLRIVGFTFIKVGRTVRIGTWTKTNPLTLRMDELRHIHMRETL